MKASIEVEHLQSDEYQVTVLEGNSRTSHKVTAQPDYCQKLTGGNIPVEELLRRSFEFLLQRESKEAILRSFDLTVIGRYFPEYEHEMAESSGR